MSLRIKALNVELGTLKNQVIKVHAMMSQENFSYNLLESQFEEMRVRNETIKKEIEVNEAKVKNALETSDRIMADINEEKRKARADIMILWTKAQARFKELEKSFDASEKRGIKEHLKALEEAAA